jgi:hypothetical protein
VELDQALIHRGALQPQLDNFQAAFVITLVVVAAAVTLAVSVAVVIVQQFKCLEQPIQAAAVAVLTDHLLADRD